MHLLNRLKFLYLSTIDHCFYISSTNIRAILLVTPAIIALQCEALPLPHPLCCSPPVWERVAAMTVPLLPPSYPLLLSCFIDPVINLLQPAGKLSVIQILLDQ